MGPLWDVEGPRRYYTIDIKSGGQALFSSQLALDVEDQGLHAISTADGM
jgi:hypothetical protein